MKVKVQLRKSDYASFAALHGQENVYVEIKEPYSNVYEQVLLEMLGRKKIVARGKVQWRTSMQGPLSEDLTHPLVTLFFNVPCSGGMAECSWREDEAGPSCTTNTAFDFYTDCEVWAGTAA